MSEIAEMVGTSPGTAQRELNRLMCSDLILFKKEAGLNIYVLNKRYPLLNEIELMVRKTVGIEAELKRELSKAKGLSFAFLFGSYAKGGFKSDSDIDLFVIGKIDEDQVFKAVHELEKTIRRDINYHIASNDEFLNKIKKSFFYKDIVKTYILLIGDEREFGKLIA